MATIAISVIDPSESSKTNMTAPNDVPVGDLTESMVEQMRLPLRDGDGRPLRYQLSLRTEHGQLDRLAEDRTLEQNGVLKGAVLQLSVETIPVEKGRRKSLGDNIIGFFKSFNDKSTSDPAQEPSGIPINLDVYDSNQRQATARSFNVDTNIPVWVLISQLTRQLNMPTHDPSGNSLVYYLERQNYSRPFDEGPLDNFETLESQNVQKNANLKLTGVPVQIARLKQLLNTKALDDKELVTESASRSTAEFSGYPKEIRYLFNKRDLLRIKGESHRQASDPKTLEKIDRTVELIYGILSRNQSQLESPPYLETRPHDVEFTSTSVRSQAISIVVYSPENAQVHVPFNVYIEVSVSLDDLAWMWLSNKDPMNFDIMLYIPENESSGREYSSPNFHVIGTDSRRLSLPMEPGQHRITTTCQLRPKRIGHFPIHFDIFQEGRYLNTLVSKIRVQTEPVSEEDDEQKINKTIHRLLPGREEPA